MRRLKSFLSSYWILIALVIAKLVIQMVAVNPTYELQRDEFLYLDQAKHLSAGYICVPPLSSWISTIIFWLGGSEFWIRFFPALAGAFTLVFVWLTAEALGARTLGKLAAGLAFLVSVYIRLNILFQPNAFDTLAWTAILYLTIRLIKDKNPIWIYWLMVAFVLGFYNKYTIGFLFAGLTVGILATPQRRLLLNRHLVIALGIGFVLVLPNIIWQLQNGIPFIHHMEALKVTQLDHTSTLSFFVDQILFIAGSIAIVFAALFGLLFGKHLKDYRTIGVTAIATLLLFALFKAKSYYAIGLYAVLFGVGAAYLDQILAKRWRLPILSFLIVANIGSFVSIHKIILPVLSPQQIVANNEPFRKLGMLRWNDGKEHELPQDFADMQGWKEMAHKALNAYQSIPTNERSSTLIFCGNYGETGALNYYNRGKMPEAYSFNTDYIFWIPKLDRISNIVLVGGIPENDVINKFQSFTVTDSVTNKYAIERGVKIMVLRNAVPSFTNQFYRLTNDRIRKFDFF